MTVNDYLGYALSLLEQMDLLPFIQASFVIMTVGIALNIFRRD